MKNGFKGQRPKGIILTSKMSRSKKINVRGLEEVDDPSYRYRMTPIQVTVQKTKSVLTNLKEVAKDLERDPRMLIEYFKKRFGISLKYEESKDRAEVKGVDQDQFQTAVYEFIQFFVLCPTCRNPETVLSKRGEVLSIACKACSHSDVVDVSNRAVSKAVDGILRVLP